MQRKEFIGESQLNDLIEFILSEPGIESYESYSAMEEDLIQLKSLPEFQKYISERMESGTTQFGFGIYHPDAGGELVSSKINLNPKYAAGKKFRFRLDGWAILFLHLELKKGDPKIECRLSINSKNRAETWQTTNPEFGNPDFWDWKNVESRARRIISRLKKSKLTH